MNFNQDDATFEPKRKTMNKIVPWVILGLVIIGLAGSFYWFEWRPVKVRRHCQEQNGGKKGENYKFNYEKCLNWWGLK